MNNKSIMIGIVIIFWRHAQKHYIIIKDIPDFCLTYSRVFFAYSIVQPWQFNVHDTAVRMMQYNDARPARTKW